MEKEKLQMRAIVKGRVQGVFFRATTRSYAEQLNLVGRVKNLPDGTVEIIAQGEKSQCERLLTLLQEDAGMARVEGVECHFSPIQHHFSSFH